MNQSKSVGLPEKVNSNDYSIYYVSSANETCIFDRKNVMQTNVGFPFAFFDEKLQKKMLDWKLDEKQMRECLQFSGKHLCDLFKRNSRENNDVSLGYRIFIQLIAKKLPQFYSEYMTGILDQSDIQELK